MEFIKKNPNDVTPNNLQNLIDSQEKKSMGFLLIPDAK